MSIKETVSRRLKEARELSGMTQDDVKNLLQYKSRAQLSHYELGRRINPQELSRLASLYGVTLDWLYGITNDPKTTREDDMIVNEKERQLIEGYRNAPEKIQLIIESLLNQEAEKKS